jgi:hypothetical protein
VFPFAIKYFCAFNNQDVAVSFASVAFSLVRSGSPTWAPRCGRGGRLLAALGLAMDYDVISLSTWVGATMRMAMVVLHVFHGAVLARRSGHRSGPSARLDSVDAVWKRCNSAPPALRDHAHLAVPFLVAGACILVALRADPAPRDDGRTRRPGRHRHRRSVFLQLLAGTGTRSTFNVHGISISEASGSEGTTASFVVLNSPQDRSR